MDDAKESLVRREETRATREGVPLKHALASVLGENFDYSSATRTRILIPLEVTTGRFKDRVKLVRDELIGREDAERFRVPEYFSASEDVFFCTRTTSLLFDDFEQELADTFHAAFLGVLLHS